MLLPLVISAALGAPIGAEGLAVPLYDHDGHCTDRRFPRLAGPWLISCHRAGQLTHALHLPTGTLHTLPRPLDTAATAPGALYAPGRAGGLFTLTVAGITEAADTTVVHGTLDAPPATDGHHVALLVDGEVQAFAATARSRRTWPAAPRGWYPPALRWPVVAWVADGGETGEDVLAIRLDGRAGPTPLAAGPGHQRHVVASESHLAWVEEDAVVVWDPETEAAVRHPARTGFSAAPSLWQDVACWEERTETGVDLRCSDGLVVDGPGHQRYPSRHDRWLLYREEGRLMLYTAPAP